jgi:hypothetical protein
MKSLAFGAVLGLGLLPTGTAFAQYAQPEPAPGEYGSAPPATQPAPIESGGLAPPPSNPTETPEAAQTEAKLDDAQKKNSGRGLEWIWVNGEFGFETLGLQTFSATNLGIHGTSQTGLMYGAGLGVRLIFVTLGAKFRLATLSNYDVWTLNAEAGLRIPLGALEPYLTLGGGFASIGAFSADSIASSDRSNVSITGYNIRAGGGLDYYVTPIFSIGAAVTFEVLGLTRPGVSLSDVSNAANSQQTATSEAYKVSGSSVGSAFSGSLVLGLHF